ncbi:MAG: Ig-like domain-containing protein [Burkholderiales bacterium]
MKSYLKNLTWASITLCSALFTVDVYAAANLSKALQAKLQAAAPGDKLSVIVSLGDKVNHSNYKVQGRNKRDGRLVQALKDKAALTQPAFAYFLQNFGITVTPLWINNSFAVTAPASVINQLALLPGILSITTDEVISASSIMGSTSATAAAPEWNIAAVNAPSIWNLGYTGIGMVVANMDTGVDPAHPDLAGKWRGGTNSWYDPNGQHTTPYDGSGHGTQTMGLLVGGSANGTAIGMAPNATWIAAKLYNDAGQTTYSKIHQSFQWLMDPDGNPATNDMPDVVNASWGMAGTPGQCITEFSADIDALKAAGIMVVFAGGNDGPNANSSISPANNTGGFSAGAVDSTNTIMLSGSRGPSACDGSIFPKLVAPGVNVNTTDLSFGGLPFYASVTGTSFAAPHVSGAMALLAQAFPAASVAQIETALTQNAQDLGDTGPDNNFGNGLVNTLAAYNALGVGVPVNHPPAINSVPVTIATQGFAYSYSVAATDPDGDALTYALTTAPAGMTIAASGLINWTPTNIQVGNQSVTVRVTDSGGLSVNQSYTIVVAAPPNNPPVINSTPVATATQGVVYSYSVGATDPDGNTLSYALTTAPAGMTIASTTGVISWTPTSAQIGNNSVVVKVTDSGGLFVTQSYTIVVAAPVNHPPVINSAPVITATQGVLYTYSVGATDPDGNTLTYALTNAPTGMTIIASNGLIKWTPTNAQVGSKNVTVRVTDSGGLSVTQSYTIIVANVNDAPVAQNNSYSVNQGTVLTVAASTGVLANDSDPDGDALTAVLSAGPTKGTLTLNTNGSFTYTPNAGYSGIDTFTYRAYDGALYSNVATVTVTVVNRAPVAVNDSATAPRRTGTYTPKIIAVLTNDSDPDGTLNIGSLTIASAPNKGGSVSVNTDGTVAYTPKLNFTGTETFSYKVRDNQGANSNAATVSVSVN